MAIGKIISSKGSVYPENLQKSLVGGFGVIAPEMYVFCVHLLAIVLKSISSILIASISKMINMTSISTLKIRENLIINFGVIALEMLMFSPFYN